MNPHEDPSWARYTATILHFAEGPAIDLRRATPDVELAALRRAGMQHAFAVITAENPRGRDVSQRENDRHRARFEAALREMAVTWIPVVGASPDGSHREHGAAVEISDEQAAELARRFEQSAYYWFDGRQFRIHGALVKVAPIVLPDQPSQT